MKKLYKSTNKEVCGVCAGIAEYFDMDVTVVRLVFILLVAFAGLSVWTYFLAAIIMPEAPIEELNTVNYSEEDNF